MVNKMKMKITAIVMLALLITGCAGIDSPFQPPTGMLYTNIKAPLKINLKNTSFDINSGEARTIAFQYGIWSFSTGDSSAKAAMMNAFINQANYADYEYTNILFGLYESVIVTAYGTKVDDNEFVYLKNDWR